MASAPNKMTGVPVNSLLINNDDGTRIGEIFLLLFFSSLLISFAFIWVGLYYSLSFRVVSYLILAIFLGWIGGTLVRYFLNNDLKTLLELRQGSSLPLLSGALASGFLTTSINRYSGDDGFYLPKAVYYTEHPDSIVDLTITWVSGLPAGTTTFRFQYYETVQAIIAWLTGTKLLLVSHVLFPFLVGFMVFVSIYQLLGFFDRRVNAKWVVALFLILLMMLLGETNRAYGMFTIARAHQGKSVLIFLGFYAWVYFSLRYFIDTRWGNLLKLMVVATSLSGVTTTTFAFIPLLSLIVYLSFYISEGRLVTIIAFRNGIKYLMAMVPLLAMALQFRLDLLAHVPDRNMLKSRFSSDFMGQADMLIGSLPISLVLLIFSLIVVTFLSKQNRFWVTWIIVTVILVLNPLVSPIVMRYLTTENIYWRMFYLLPFPVIVAIAMLALYRKEISSRTCVIMAPPLFMLFGMVIYTSPTSIFYKDGAATFHWPTYKTTKFAKEIVTRFEAEFPPGSMVTHPKLLAVPFTIYSSHYPQIILNDELLMFFRPDAAWRDDALNRIRASRYLYKGSNDSEDKASFERVLSVNRPDYVMQNIEMLNSNDVEVILKAHGYYVPKIKLHYNRIHPDYVVWKSIHPLVSNY